MTRARKQLRPLADPRRARYVRAVLDRKQRAAERAAARDRDPDVHARTLERLRGVIAQVDAASTGDGGVSSGSETGHGAGPPPGSSPAGTKAAIPR